MEKILITGCSSGFGKALLKDLSKKYFIICISRRKPSIRKKNIEFYKCDLSSSLSLSLCISKIKKKHKYIPYIINNAGVFKISSLENINLSDIVKFFKINSFAPTIIIKKFISEMKKNNFGRIINITSGAVASLVQMPRVYRHIYIGSMGVAGLKTYMEILEFAFKKRHVPSLNRLLAL